MPRKSTKSAEPTTTIPQTPSTPTVGEKGEKGGAKALLDKLKAKTKAEAPKPAAKGKDRPVIRLTGAEAEALDRLTSADQIAKIADGGQKAAKTGVADTVKQHYLRMCVERGSKPDNPTITTDASRANYVVKHMKKLNLTDANGKPITVGAQLASLGFPQPIIDQIEGKVVKEKEVMGLRSFTDLTDEEKSTAAEQAVAEKLLTFVLTELTDEEQALILTKQVKAEADESWQNLAIQISRDMSGDDTDKAVDLLDKLYAVIRPQFVFSQMLFNGDLNGALGRLQAAPPVQKEHKSADGKYIARCNDNKVVLYLVKPSGEEKLGEKVCDNPGHAEASAKKWFRDPTSLADFLANAK